MHFGSPRFAHQCNEWRNRIAAHHRVVHQNHTLTRQIMRQRRKFQFNTQLAQPVIRLNERAPNIAIFSETFGIRNTAGLGKAHRGWNGGVRHANHHIGGYGRFFGELLPHGKAHGVYAAPLDHAVRAGKINVFKATQGFGLCRCTRMMRHNAVRTQGNNLAWQHLTHKFGTHCCQSTGLGRHHPARRFVHRRRQSTHTQRTQPMRIAASVNAHRREYHQRIRALSLLQ